MTTPDSYVEAYLADRAGTTPDLERLVTVSSGLDAHGILATIGDPRLGRQALEVMCDLMHPTDSMYYDAIYGAFHGQHDIRNWLIPTMAEIEFIDFVPQQPTAVFDHADGASSVDEWRMVARIGDESMPLARGVSVRHYRDGWITWNADVYDTGAFRVPGPDGSAPELPDWPRTEWTVVEAEPAPTLSDAAKAWLDAGPDVARDAPTGLTNLDLHQIQHHPDVSYDMDVLGALLHPTESVYLDPLFGDFAGRSDIHTWLADVMPKIGDIRFDPVGPVLFDGSTSVEEWLQVAVQPDGTRAPMFRGTSVRRFADGWIVYAADYFDTAPLSDPAISGAGLAAGSTLTAEDIARHRRL